MEAIAEVLYNEDRNEIISSHRNGLQIWQFRYANKHLVPRTTISLPDKDHCFTIHALERTHGEHQRLFLAHDRSVTVLDLSRGTTIAEHRYLHEMPITALGFFNPLKLLVTGCKVGSIKIWSLISNEIALNSVFVGHTNSINSLAFFPGGCQATIASCGNDKTLRVWSLELSDEVECLDLEYSSNAIGSDITRSTFFTVGSNFIDIWRQSHIADELLTVSSEPSFVEVVAENPGKMLITCRNNLVFYIKLSQPTEVVTRTVISLSNEHQQAATNRILSTVTLDNRNMLLVLMQVSESSMVR